MNTAPVVFITGASAGIGMATAEEFAQAQPRAKFILLARRTDRLQSLATKLQKQGSECLVCVGDVTRREDQDAAVEKGLARFGRIDIAIANAGFGVVGRMDELKIEDYRRQFETNVFGLMHTVYAVLPALKKSQGRLTLIGSVASYISMAEGSAYSMSKFAVRALAQALRPELARDGVSVTLISPGLIESEIRKVDNQGQWHEKDSVTIPAWLLMPTQQAAAQIVQATLSRKREKIITWHGWAIVCLMRYFPGLAAWLMMRGGVRGRKQPRREN